MADILQWSQYAEKGSRNVLESELSELAFTSFNGDVAFNLGQIIRSMYLEMKKKSTSGILISIRLYNGLILFQCACGLNVTPHNEDWVRRKMNTVKEYGIPTLLKRRLLEEKGADPNSLGKDHAAHGGGFPICIENVGPIGVIVVSGLKQEQDHAIIVHAIKTLKSSNNSTASKGETKVLSNLQ